ncbi:MAG: hypothetical protein WCQ45_06070 [bacterium]
MRALGIPDFSQGGGFLTERWRKPLKPLAQWVPIDFLLAWIDVESNGKPDEVSNIGERGLFQVHPDERDFLHLTDDQFQSLTTDTNFALQVGVAQAIAYAIFAKRELSAVGSEWHGRDFWKLVKLHHGAFSVPKFMLLAFQNTFGRGPTTWREFQAFAFDAANRGVDVVPGDPTFSAKLRALVPNTFNNAEKTGERSGIDEIKAPTIASVGALLRSFGLMV